MDVDRSAPGIDLAQQHVWTAGGVDSCRVIVATNASFGASFRAGLGVALLSSGGTDVKHSAHAMVEISSGAASPPPMETASEKSVGIRPCFVLICERA